MKTRLLALLTLTLFACAAPPIGVEEDWTEDGEPLNDLAEAESALTVDPALLAAAEANLTRIAKDIDAAHLAVYRYDGTDVKQFLTALKTEYGSKYPELYLRKLQVLASIAFVNAPTLMPPASGRRTVFHGLNEVQYSRLQRAEDAVFAQLVSENGGRLSGVPPFSVCETRYLIDAYVKGARANASMVFNTTTWNEYRMGYRAYANSCPKADLEEWYNFRGLGKLRPSWLEANVMDRYLRRFRQSCSSNDPQCTEYKAGPLAFRAKMNAELGRRMLLYPSSQQVLLANYDAPAVLVPDRNGDGVGELVSGSSTLVDESGATQKVVVQSTGSFTGELNVLMGKAQADAAVMTGFDPSVDLARADFGLLRLVTDGSGCATAQPGGNTCPLLQRFNVMINRHESFYDTYTSLYPNSKNLGAQPSPLTACSITLAAADKWARMSPVGTQGFVYVMRVPFREVLAGHPMRVATGAVPAVTPVSALYDGSATLDFSKVWLDIASLSKNLFSDEHEISKYGFVPAEQIEGMIYVGAVSP
ncbi:MAG: hypothetical protein ACT4TC_08225 [Myxococcaceae bacterium]